MTSKRNAQLRRQVAYEAARLMADEGAADPRWALQKAAARVGLRDRRDWPDAAEVDEALREQQRLFRPRQPDHLRALRQTALRAMEALARFRPRLVGPVLDGSADAQSRVSLYLFVDTPEEVIQVLLELRIPWRETQRRLGYANGKERDCPGLRFWAGEVAMELLMLPAGDRSNPPLNPVTERPDQGAGIARVRELLEEKGGD